MAFSDYWNGPAHRQRADDLDIQLTELQGRQGSTPFPRTVIKRL